MEIFISKYLVTIICCAVILYWFFGAKEKFIKSITDNPFGDYEQPRTAQTLGVLCTFIGIAWGLVFFDPAPHAMQASVVNLLGGMTTAFVTSILGMGISIYLKNEQLDAQKNFPSLKLPAKKPLQI